ncbi:SSI family serine proteinase inhibitor [Actinomadura opuntiae]|uniref:SSI family serine proteinase inhibitor n=1 Tax=Actinomadura sp. OS1-43 TaxID=604315 RepID=UPI00255AD2EB|nr:SSI family serine proteinase inhibitor [Actinomadura sp. OS1-43]MDL4820377.1 SSI family serine proteinase inhibitor [Actinomadura sp. OS1-43]
MSNIIAVIAGAVLALSPTVHAHDGEAKTSLRLTLTHPGHDTSGTRAVTLYCDPPGGRHPDPARACSELEGSGGKFTHAPDGRMCTQVYAPVVAAAEGRWHGNPVSFHAQYANDCVMHSHTGTVFAF